MVEKKFLWIIVSFILCIVIFETTSQQFYPMRYGKRDESGPGGTQRFHTGSRYGRSQGAVEVTARNDRFFLGSRYGKRASTVTQGLRSSSELGSRYGRSSGQVQVASRNDKFFLGSRYGKRNSITVPPLEDSTMPKSMEDATKHVSCSYTGVGNLYQCYHQFETNEESTNSF